MLSTCTNKGDYLLIEVTGTYTFKGLITTIHEVAEHCRQEKLGKVLIDLRNVSGRPNNFERYQLGLEIARVWGNEIRAAVVAPVGVGTRMTENTAVNRGAQMKATTSMDEAMGWLELKQEPKHA